MARATTIRRHLRHPMTTDLDPANNPRRRMADIRLRVARAI